MSVLFAAHPRTGGTRSAGRHRPFTCQHWRSKDCNLKRAAPSDVWGNLCIIVTTRKVLAEKSRWLMGFPLNRCGFARAIAAILAPTSRALFPWNVPIVLNIQFSRSRNYFLLYTANMKFSLLAVAYFSNGGCRAAAAQRGLGRAPKFALGYPNAMLAKLTGLGKKAFSWFSRAIAHLYPGGFLLESIPAQNAACRDSYRNPY